MKNKKTLFLLIPLVLVIWGVVIWKLIDYQPSGENSCQHFLTKTEEIATDTARYELRFGYRDPFLRSYVRAVSIGSSKKRKKTNNIKQIDFSRIYLFVITNGFQSVSGLINNGKGVFIQ